MNYPVWEVAFGSGLVIAAVSILHVFVSHFAVGGGLFLVLAERKAYRAEDGALLAWVRRHSKFFVLLTVVFGAVSGVGIWFTIGLAHPAGTGTLIRIFLWAWAVEWVFFFLEITAALLYLNLWDRVSRKTHLRLGWIYFACAYLSLVVINGIIAFMLTPGDWIETRSIWDGFFNPTYFPSLVFRSLAALALAGIYAFLTATRLRDEETRARIVRWSGQWVIGAFLLLPLAGWWYAGALPDAVWEQAGGRMPTASRFLLVLGVLSAAIFLLALVALVKPRRFPFPAALLVTACALGAMGSFEFVRESVRKPYLIRDYLYANSLMKASFAGERGDPGIGGYEGGFLKTARWAGLKEFDETNSLEAGKELFRLQCSSCHTENGYRGLKQVMMERRWNAKALEARIQGLHRMFDGVMPPFTGTMLEAGALAGYLASLAAEGSASPIEDRESAGGVEEPDGESGKEPLPDGEEVFKTHCLDCHESAREDPLFEGFRGLGAEQIADQIADLPGLDDLMPPFEGTDPEREALARWIHDQIVGGGP